MDPFEIKALMKKSGVYQADIARRLGITREYVRKVIHGERSTRRVRQAIADALGMPFEEVWGEENERISYISPTKMMKERGYVSLSFMLSIDRYKGSRSLAAIYKDAAEGKLEIEVYRCPGKKKKYYFIKVLDPVLKANMDLFNKLKSMTEEETKMVRVKLPKDISDDINSISDYRGIGYKRFFSFIRSNPDEIIRSTFGFFLDKEVEYVERRIRIKPDDLKILNDIAKKNNMNLSKVIEIFLRGFKTIGFGAISSEGVIGK
jgi:transcriptional regulator with XRE-family HTH domain